jgi:NAD(P)-dependent dehydrogenase (short-subunit alcohol dehydrogenase family)
MGRTYVVTGANRGIGLEFARQLAGRGDRVVATARRPEEAAELAALPVRVEALDLAASASVEAFGERLAGEAVDVLLHNAAVGVEGPALAALRTEDVELSFRVNATGVVELTRVLLPNLRAGQARQILALTSGLGSVSRNDSGGWYAYRASKAALNQLVRTMAHELSVEGFTCLVISPGWVRTEMGGPEAPLTAEESVSAMLRVFDRLTPADTNKFLDQRGRAVPW